MPANAPWLAVRLRLVLDSLACRLEFVANPSPYSRGNRSSATEMRKKPHGNFDDNIPMFRIKTILSIAGRDPGRSQSRLYCCAIR